jgi:hypothetical protein
MRLDVVMGRRIFFGNAVVMRILCVINARRSGNEWGRLQVSQLQWILLFLRDLLSPMMIVLLLLFTVNIQNQRENFGTMMALTNLFIFLV